MRLPKGMRDILPEEMEVRNWIIRTISKVYESYGFLPLETPAMEYLSVLKAKSGEEIAGQIYKIEGEEVGLRFDLTVSLARLLSNSAFPRPFKRYQIGRVWRKEEPQKGRYREFFQADADIVGSRSMRAEAELLTAASEILEELGLKTTFYLNNRKILNALSSKVSIEDKKFAVFRLLDKTDKIGKERVFEELSSLIGESKSREIFELLEGELEDMRTLSEEGVSELEEIIALAENVNIKYDAFLVRGLAYYTGPVFEISAGKEIGRIGGGGRYDNLLQLYGRGDYATGIGLGIDRIAYFLSGKVRKKSAVFIANTKGLYNEAKKVASLLRKEGIACEVDLNERSLRKQLEYANARKFEYVLIVGEEELKKDKLLLRNMKSGKEEVLSIKEVVAKLKE